MQRSFRIAFLIASAVLVAGCQAVTGSGDPSSAATVNGEKIELEDIERQMSLAGPAGEAEPEGDELAQLQAEILQYLIRLELLEQGGADLGVEFTDEDLEQAREDLIAQAGGEEVLNMQLEEAGLELDDLDQQLKSQTLETRIGEALSADIDVSDDDVQAFYDAQFGERPTARHILLETEEEALDTIDELDEGADFNELATERSTDPSAEQNAGELGGVQAGQMVPEFEEAVFDAEVGEIVGPVETQFGFHVIEVTDVAAPEGTPDLEDIESEIRAQLAQQSGGQEAFMEWITDLAETADIEVNPRFGTWDAENMTVVPESALDSENADDDG